MGVLLVKGNIYPFWRSYPIREYSLLSNIRKAMQRHISKKAVSDIFMPIAIIMDCLSFIMHNLS